MLSRPRPTAWVRAALTACALLSSLCACGAPPAGRHDAIQAPQDLHIAITGSGFEWLVRYPGADGKLGTGDDVHDRRDLWVPAGRRVHLDLHSRDYIYTIRFPAQGLEQAAVPELDFDLELEESRPGEYPLDGDQMCGFSHARLIGRLHVVDPERFEDRMRAAPRQ